MPRIFWIIAWIIGFSSGCAERSDVPPPVCAPDSSERVTEPIVSAQRRVDESWEEALDRAIERAGGGEFGRVGPSPKSARSLSVGYGLEMDVSHLPQWPGSAEAFVSAFRKMRDERLYMHESRPQFLRRTTWLYPIDGCFVRAAHAAQSMARQKWPRPGKIFAFGRLRAKTEFAFRGYAYWSYHVAPAYRVGERAFVLDVTIEPLRPLELHEWIARMARDPNQVRISICDTWAYMPSQKCRGASPSQERSSGRHQKHYLSKEWAHVRRLGRVPERVLGLEPPWRDFVQPVLAPIVEGDSAGARGGDQFENTEWDDGDGREAEAEDAPPYCAGARAARGPLEVTFARMPRN